MKTTGDAWQLHAFVDGELDIAGQLAIEQRMAGDETLRQQAEELRALSEKVRANADRHTAPAAFRERMGAILEATRPQAQPSVRVAGHGRSKWTQTLDRWLGWRPLIVSTAFVTIVAVALNVAMLQSSKQERLMAEAVASHVRSTVGEHLVDVASSDHHAVKPFLSARLGFSPPVRALQMPGSVFLGGRIDYLDGRPVAALVYRQGEHVVNSFVWPDARVGDSKPEFASERGFLVAHWTQGGMRHCVISDLNHDEFHTLVEAVRSASASG